ALLSKGYMRLISNVNRFQKGSRGSKGFQGVPKRFWVLTRRLPRDENLEPMEPLEPLEPLEPWNLLEPLGINYVLGLQCRPSMADTYLGEFEPVVLLAILRLGEDAYESPVREEIERRTGRAVARGALYTAL